MIKVVWYNCSQINDALDGLEVWKQTFYKLAAMSLHDYDKVLAVDFDITMLAPVSQMMRETSAPAMVSWYGVFNSGVTLIKPSRDLYHDVLSAIKLLEPISAGRQNRLRSRLAGGQVMANRSEALRMANEAAAVNSDQDFLMAFFDYTHREKHGPMHMIHPRFNVRSKELLDMYNNHMRLKPEKPSNDRERELYILMQLSVGGWAEAEVPNERGPALVHSTMDKIHNTNQCPKYHLVFWQAALEEHDALCRPNTTAENRPKRPLVVQNSRTAVLCKECQCMSDRFGTYGGHWGLMTDSQQRQMWMSLKCQTTPNDNENATMWCRAKFTTKIAIDADRVCGMKL